ncbi:MarR family winged helix-turn-helix transcriptional regulator [Sneathiella sp. HT1-7]|jgi:DNA-binding MarR family transcriptional regulator|uniref:MarR family winged helix-turn-helix transcriptional regulator n=1 Tax=Sneathiella sp. HT1-7 TaxID=2887192 RepID=UPI001D1421A9|nr:MarR family transcriptional regulator [Sneathiella sp. HT1-7]MCC3305163.1 MarR family transcriptional regulator [Sneathiella sp. HT1-7]
MSNRKEKITDNLAYVLAQAHRNVHQMLEKQLRLEGMQVENWRILDVLSDEKGRSMGDLAEIVLMNHPALTKMLDKMVANGLAHRTLDPNDQRKVIVFITNSGLELHQKLNAHAVEFNKKFSSNIGTKKLQELKDLLNEIIDETTPVQ